MKVKCIVWDGDNVFKFYLHKSRPRFKCRDCEFIFDFNKYYKHIGTAPLDKWVVKK